MEIKVNLVLIMTVKYNFHSYAKFGHDIAC